MTLPVPAPETIMTFFLVLARIGAIMTLAPLFSSRTISMRIKAVCAILITVVMFPIASPDSTPTLEMSEIVMLLMKEVFVGLAIGMAAGVVIWAFQAAGNLLDLSVGFSYSGMLDPQNGTQSGVMSQLYGLLAIMIFLVCQGDLWVIEAMARSFDRIPLIEQGVQIGDFITLAEIVASTIFVSGLGIAAPVLVAMLITDVAFGLLSRAAPQTQIIQVEFPVKIAAGLAMIIFPLPFLVPVATSLLDRMLGLTVGSG